MFSTRTCKNLVYWNSHGFMNCRLSPQPLLISTYLRLQNDEEGALNLRETFNKFKQVVYRREKDVLNSN